MIRADGQVFRRIASKPGYCLDRTKTRSTGCPATRQANSRSPGKDGPQHRTVATRGYSFREGQPAGPVIEGMLIRSTTSLPTECL